MTDAASAHLRAADPVLARLIDRLGALEEPEVSRARPTPGEHYAGLVRTIVGQQLSTRAAQAIWLRLLAHFDGLAPSPEQVLAADPEELRAAAGLSRSKTTYLRSLAEHVLDGSLELDRLEALGDDEVSAELVAVKGIGEWSAHMFLMFQLGRLDVWPTGDYGVRNGFSRMYDLPEMLTPKVLEAAGEPFHPYRSIVACWCWRAVDEK